MNRYKFIDETIERIVQSEVASGQKWRSVVDGSTLTIMGRQGKAWVANVSMEGRLRVHDLGERNMSEDFILSFYKKI